MKIILVRDLTSHWNNKNQTYNTLEIVNYANNSYVGDINNWKSIIEYYFFLVGVIITWYSKQQQTILILISEVKHIAMSHKIRERVWIQKFLYKLLIEQSIRRIEIFGNDKTSFTLTKDQKS